MQNLFTNRPVLSYLLITFFVTYLFWFMPAFIVMPKDLTLALGLIGGCGPLIAAYLITVSNSKAKFKIGSLPIFVIIFVLACIVMITRILMVDGDNPKDATMPLMTEVSWMAYLLFGLAFLVLALNASNATNKNLLENHIKSFLPEKGKLKWYVLGFILIPVMSLVGYSIGLLLGWPVTDILVDIQPKFLVGFLSTFLFFGSNEEFGWRGFMQKEMQKKQSPLITALVISFFWSLWHLPLHYNGFYSTGGFMDLLPRFVWMIPITIIFSWLYNRSRYALLAVMILHASMNNVSSAFGTSEWIYFMLTIVVAIYFVFSAKMWKKQNLQPN